METNQDVYERVTDDSGETLYCPVGAVSTIRAAAGPSSDECVEASTVGRYSGNMAVVDRFAR